MARGAYVCHLSFIQSGALVVIDIAFVRKDLRALLKHFLGGTLNACTLIVSRKQFRPKQSLQISPSGQ